MEERYVLETHFLPNACFIDNGDKTTSDLSEFGRSGEEATSVGLFERKLTNSCLNCANWLGVEEVEGGSSAMEEPADLTLSSNSWSLMSKLDIMLESSSAIVRVISFSVV